MVDLRHAVSNDHAGSLYPAAVPAAGVFVQVILEQPGEPGAYALSTLLDWLGCFGPEPGFEVYDNPAGVPVEITEGDPADRIAGSCGSGCCICCLSA